MRFASTDQPRATVFAFNHESTSAMERHVIGGCAALPSEVGCPALPSEAGLTEQEATLHQEG